MDFDRVDFDSIPLILPNCLHYTISQNPLIHKLVVYIVDVVKI